MKKKLIVGLSLITVLFILSGFYILKNLKTILSNHELVEFHEMVIEKFDNMLFIVKDSQAVLYRHQAGYSRDIDSLVENVFQFEEKLISTENELMGYLGNRSCNMCHSIKEKLQKHKAMIRETNTHLDEYKDLISRIVTQKDFTLSKELEKEAAGHGEEVIEILLMERDSLGVMNKAMEKYKVVSINNAIYSIIIALIVSVMLSYVVILLTVKSITGPVNVLIRGIKKVSSGDFNSKVDISSHDEIGFIADTFNNMIGNLKKATRKKDELMSELQDLNSNLEGRVRKATEELRIAHEKMLRTETLSIVGTFASGVAHELATPLSSLISYIQMLKGKFQGHEGIEDLNMVEGELHRLRIILGGMLDFARVPNKERISTDINAIINELLELLRYQNEYKNIMVKKDMDTGIPAISAVPGQLKQVFMNIIMNALQAMPDGGELTVSTSTAEEGRKVMIRISDTGPGITQDEIGKIFQPFFSSKESGTGLGLSISYGIVKGHNGEIAVKSNTEKGTAFTISLPV